MYFLTVDSILALGVLIYFLFFDSPWVTKFMWLVLLTVILCTILLCHYCGGFSGWYRMSGLYARTFTPSPLFVVMSWSLLGLTCFLPNSNGGLFGAA